MRHYTTVLKWIISRLIYPVISKHKTFLCEISGFHREVAEISGLLVYSAAYDGNSLPLHAE